MKYFSILYKLPFIEENDMFAVKGFYDGKSIVVEEPILVKEQYEVIVTFISSVVNENKKSYLEELRELNGSIKDDTFVECEDIPLENNLYLTYQSQV